MSVPQFDLINSGLGNYALVQNHAMKGLEFYFRDRNLSTYTPLGEIRDNFRDCGGKLLATFDFEPLQFRIVTLDLDQDGTPETPIEATIIEPSLTALQTSLIPATIGSSRSKVLYAGINAHVYDLILTSPNETITVVRGLVEVLPGVTHVFQ